MVRKASRLPPTTKSVEEILLERMAGGSTSASNGHSARSSAAAASARSSTRRHASVTTAPAPRHSMAAASPPARASASVPAASTGASSSESSLEALKAMASDISSLDARLQGLATSLLPASSPSHPSSSSNTADSLRSTHQLAIEQFLADSIRELQPPRKSTPPPNSSMTLSSVGGAQVTHSVRELRSTVRRLDRVFYEVATGDKQRHLAATAISMLVRSFLVRRRFARLRVALGSWRARVCAGFLGHVEQFSAREEFLNAQVASMAARRQAAMLQRLLAELRDVVLLRLPLRMHQRDESDARFRSKQLALLRRVTLPWKAGALGPRSRKQAALSSRERHLAARQRLEATGRFDVLTPEMVHEEFLKANVRTVRSNHGRHVLRMYLRLLVDEVLKPLKRRWALAEDHARRKALLSVWQAWLPVFRAQQVDKAIASAADGSAAGSEAADGGGRRRIATLERFDKPVNLRRIDAHCRLARLRRHLRAWHRFCALLRRVRALFESTTRGSLGVRLRRWRLRATYQRALRANAVEMWQAYCRRVFQTPFRAWYVFAAKRRARRLAQEQICVAYARRARRQAKYTFFRLWKHQALFGTVEGAHSRLSLLRGLEDQKRLSLSLEANAALYRDNIAALQASIEQLEDKLMEKQQELARAFADAQSTRFGIHAAEQGIARVQGLLEAVRHVHPGSVARLERAFADNPLLSVDLSEVLARHAETRRQLLARLERDEAAINVCEASKGSSVPLGSDDQLLLHRVKWLLSRLDLRTSSSVSSSGEKSEAVGQLCALFEFLRDGDTSALAPANDPERDRNPLLDWTGQGSSAGNQEAARASRSDLMEQAEPWTAFLKSLALQFVPDKMRTVKERLLRRAQEADDELQALKASPHIYNLYSGSAMPQ